MEEQEIYEEQELFSIDDIEVVFFNAHAYTESIRTEPEYRTHDVEQMLEGLFGGIIFGFALAVFVGLLSWGITAVCRLFKKMINGR